MLDGILPLKGVEYCPENDSMPLDHGSLEGVGGFKTYEAYHSKADTLVIPEMYFFCENLSIPFWKCLFYKIRHLFRFVLRYRLWYPGDILANGIWNAS